MKKQVGIFGIWIISLITVTLWILSKNPQDNLFSDSFRSVSQLFALLGIVMMSTVFITSTHISFIEDLFGGLDRVYKTHHILGMISFIMLVNHPLLLASKAMPNMKAVSLYLFPGLDLSYNLGVFAAYIMIFSFISIVFIKLPYHVWLQGHRLLGIAGLLGGIHAALISSDVSSFLPLRIWILAWSFMGTLAFLYKILIYPNTKIAKYEIIEVSQSLDIVSVMAKAKTAKLSFVPGQFGFVSFKSPGLSSEPHPFSFSSSPAEETVRFSIKMLGDFTLHVPRVKVGDTLFIKGPYGRFGHSVINSKNRQIWIAGGIGITPFLSLLRHISINDSKQSIVLFYSYGRKEEAIFDKEINDLIYMNENIVYVPWCTYEKGRVSVDKMKAYLDSEPSNYIYHLCGPAPMMSSITKNLIHQGVDEENIYFEEFQMNI